MIGPDPDAGSHIRDRFKKLVNLGGIRVNELLETLQYAFLYAIVTFYMGYLTESLFPEFDEKKPLKELFFEVMLQGAFLTIIVFYTRKIVKTIPLLVYVRSGEKYIPYLSSEFNGEIIISAILITSQVNLLKKVTNIAERLELTRKKSVSGNVEK